MEILSGLEELAMAEKTFNINERGSQAVDRSKVRQARQLWRGRVQQKLWQGI